MKNDFDIVEYYDKGSFGRGADSLKFWVMPFVCFMVFGFIFPDTYIGGLMTIFSRFAPIVFFILCGFFALPPNREKRMANLTKAIKKSGVFFAVLFAVYFIVNAVNLSVNGVNWLPEVFRLRTIFNFTVLNMWPFLSMGDSIWFIQSLFHAYIILWLADRFDLLRFYKPMMLLLFAVMILLGEFAGLIRLELYIGYQFIPGGTFTRALPYMLLGMFIREKAKVFLRPKKFIYVVFCVAGVALAYGELLALQNTGIYVYSGHLIGLGILAGSLSCWALSLPSGTDTFASLHGKTYSKYIYALAPLMAFVLLLLAGLIGEGAVDILSYWLGLATYLMCLLVTYIIRFSRFGRIVKRLEQEALEEEADGTAEEVSEKS